MRELCTELSAEYRDLADFAKALAPHQWSLTTGFYGWSPWDEIAHLCLFDETALLAVSDAGAFERDKADIARQMADGLEISQIARARFAGLSGESLLAHWRTRFEALIGRLAERDPKARLPWYGPSMSARSFATARMMEVWAHGQDIYDVMAARRQPTHRLRDIAHIGVTTFGWTFVNRGLPVPAQAPYIELTGPDGDTWSWNEPSGSDFVRGDAEDFCLVVTQRRNVADTRLEYRGPAASSWLAIAQCFAGAPADPPRPGARVFQA